MGGREGEKCGEHGCATGIGLQVLAGVVAQSVEGAEWPGWSPRLCDPSSSSPSGETEATSLMGVAGLTRTVA